ncbi:ribonuclease P protein component [Nocardioides sp.]|uniref:ribonuclease P protein component n=1 Tax=Nocardioides sp. TaxID=35761 RepID=UPI002D1F9A89|nr:ribonuclease P protein component [Nocardioides sp.]
MQPAPVLPQANRLTSGEAFRRTVRSGRRAGCRTLVCHWSPPQEPPRDPGAADSVPCVKVGFVVSRAVGSAVTRTRVKRRLRHLVRERLGSLPPCGVLVVRALPPAAGAPSAELRADLARCLDRLVERDAA